MPSSNLVPARISALCVIVGNSRRHLKLRLTALKCAKSVEIPEAASYLIGIAAAHEWQLSGRRSRQHKKLDKEIKKLSKHGGKGQYREEIADLCLKRAELSNLAIENFERYLLAGFLRPLREPGAKLRISKPLVRGLLPGLVAIYGKREDETEKASVARYYNSLRQRTIRLERQVGFRRMITDGSHVFSAVAKASRRQMARKIRR